MSFTNRLAEYSDMNVRRIEWACAARLEISAKTDKGRRRRRNEDRALAQIAHSASTTAYLLAVADGVGGGPAGDKASETAVSTLAGYEIDATMRPDAVLRAAFETANRRIVAEAANEPACLGMAT